MPITHYPLHPSFPLSSIGSPRVLAQALAQDGKPQGLKTLLIMVEPKFSPREYLQSLLVHLNHSPKLLRQHFSSILVGISLISTVCIFLPFLSHNYQSDLINQSSSWAHTINDPLEIKLAWIASVVVTLPGIAIPILFKQFIYIGILECLCDYFNPPDDDLDLYERLSLLLLLALPGVTALSVQFQHPDFHYLPRLFSCLMVTTDTLSPAPVLAILVKRNPNLFHPTFLLFGYGCYIISEIIKVYYFEELPPSVENLNVFLEVVFYVITFVLILRFWWSLWSKKSISNLSADEIIMFILTISSFVYNMLQDIMDVGLNQQNWIDFTPMHLVADISVQIAYTLIITTIPSRLVQQKLFETHQNLRNKQAFVRYVSHEIR